MSKRKKSPRNRPTNKQRSRARSLPAGRRREPDLVETIADHLDDPSPLGLLGYVSALLDAVDARNRNPFDRSDPELTLETLLPALLESASRETSAMLAVIAAFVADDLQRARIKRELATRSVSVPDWLTRLGDAVPLPPLQRGHVLGDGENLIIGLSIPGTADIAASVFIDHNLGSVAKDAFPVPASVDEVDEVLVQVQDDPDMTRTWVEPADARARIADAIESGALSYPPYETDTWPGSRPLVEWMCSFLPSGGRGIDRREWDDAEQRQVAEQFFRSTHGAPFRDDPESVSRLDGLLWYGTGYSTCDPYRWSVPKLEVLMLDWIPRKIMAPPEFLELFPDLIRAFVEFAHDHVGIPDRLTHEAMDAIDAFEPEFLDLIADEMRPQGVQALFDAMGMPAFDPRGALAAEVGGQEQLDALDSRPLPDEEFDHTGIEPAAMAKVRAVVDLLDPVAEQTFGVEARTACRRLLRMVALADPTVILRGKRDEITAGAVCWMVGLNNELFQGDVLVRDLLARFNVKGSVSQRAEAMRAALGLRRGENGLGSADLLVSSAREQICRVRDGDL